MGNTELFECYLRVYMVLNEKEKFNEEENVTYESCLNITKYYKFIYNLVMVNKYRTKKLMNGKRTILV